jgi:hypothetical protein
MRIPSRPDRFLGIVFGLVVGLAGVTAASAGEKEAAPPRPIRVLFVGNSQVYYNDLPQMVEALSESAPADRPRIRADRALAGGASLESHWNRGTGKGTPRAKIAEEKWDYVVLQEIFNARPDTFGKYARLFHDLIRQNGAQTILLSTASISTLYAKGFQELHDMNIALGKELKVPVAAAGRAWLSYWGEGTTPEQRLALYDPDKAHPGKKGSYIYACTLYAALTGHSPVGLTHRIPKQPEDTVSPAQAKQFQEAAWRVHQAVNGKRSATQP